MKRKVQEVTTQKEEWSPTEAEFNAFCEMMKEFTEWKPASVIKFGGFGGLPARDVEMKAGTYYKESKNHLSRLQAKAKFGAITFSEYMGHPQEAIRIHVQTNDFMKSGAGRLSLYDQFQELEKRFFRREYGRQRSLEELDQTAPPMQ